ncbi:hypothetical protein B7486_19505 [cyanobacterium TDX16]|nr:hypothetical protein B7486_19505 [cyanobacterium TDX16]
MAKKNQIKEVDAYIAKSADFAKPILKKIREIFHKACPKAEEAMKWNCPAFMYHGMLGGMAAFKNHATWGLWRSQEHSDPLGLFNEKCSGNFNSKLTSVKDLPPDKVLIAYIKEAMKLNEAFEAGERKGSKKKSGRKDPNLIKPPADLAAAMKKNKKALAAFEAFPYSHRKEYVEWITEAKRDETRKQRIATAVEWMAQGKSRNWKYTNC